MVDFETVELRDEVHEQPLSPAVGVQKNHLVVDAHGADGHINATVRVDFAVVAAACPRCIDMRARCQVKRPSAVGLHVRRHATSRVSQSQIIQISMAGLSWLSDGRPIPYS